jgi:hypothetical protein
MNLIVHVPESVANQPILQLLVSEGRLLARAVQVVRYSRHVLHSPSDLCFGLPELDRLCGEIYGFEARGADFVYGGGFDVCRQPGEDGSLTRGGLADAGAEHVAHVDGVD